MEEDGMDEGVTSFYSRDPSLMLTCTVLTASDGHITNNVSSQTYPS